MNKSKVVKWGMQYYVPAEVLEAVKPGTPDKTPFRRDEFAEAMKAVMEESTAQAEEIRASAEREAEEILGEARKQADVLLRKAEEAGYLTGFAKGEIDGRVKAEGQAGQLLNEAAALAEEMNRLKLEAVQDQERELICIALETANKIMRQQCRVDTNAVSKMLEELISENEGVIKLYLSELQNTLELHLDKNITKKIRSFAKDLKTVIVSEADGILLETETGIVDMSIPVQMENIATALLEECVG
jgi:flagellar assembly protein FliH